MKIVVASDNQSEPVNVQFRKQTREQAFKQSDYFEEQESSLGKRLHRQTNLSERVLHKP